jgi:YD repeat-containing protein
MNEVEFIVPYIIMLKHCLLARFTFVTSDRNDFMKNTCDRLITETNALGKTRTFTYDAAGNRTSLTDRNGKTRRFSFDARDRSFPKLTDFPVTSDRSYRVLGSDRIRI